MNLNGNPGATPRKLCMTMILAITGLLVVIAPSLQAMAAAQSKASFLLSNVIVQAKDDSEQTSTDKTVDTLLRLARAEIKSGNVDAGKAILQNVLVLDPRNTDAKKELNALADQGASLSVNSQIAQSGAPIRNLSSAQLLDVARSQMGDGDYAGARATLEAAKNGNPTKKESQQIEQFITAIDSNKEKMAQVAQTQLDYNLSELDKQINKALVYIENGQWDKAEVELHRAQKISSDDKRVTALLNQIYTERSNMKQQSVAMSEDGMKEKSVQLHSAAETLFQEGVVLYKQDQVIEAVDKWMQAVEIFPEHQAAQTYLTNTRVEYDQAVKAREMAEQMAKQEAGYEEMLDTVIPQYSTQGDLIDVKDVLSTLISFTKLNLAMDENLAGNVALEMQNSSLREILNVIQKQYGFVWTREGNTIYVKPGFKTRVFALTDGQYKTLDLILSDPSSIADSSRNLKNILYGPQQEFNVPGKQLYLSQTTRSLNITDTEENIRKVEAFLSDMPEIIGETQPVELGIYKVRKEIAKEIYEIIRVTLYGEQDPIDVRDNRRKLVLEPKSSSLIITDYPENIRKVEQILSDQDLDRKIEDGELEARQFQLTDPEDLDDTPEAIARREEYVRTIAEVLRNMLYGREGLEQAALQGRQLFENPDRGTIDVIDTAVNLRKVEQYLNSIRGESTQDIQIERFVIEHVSVFDIADALGYLFFDSQQSTRSQFLSTNNVQSIGTDTQGGNQDVSNLFEQTTQDRFNLTGGGGGGADLLQFFDIRFYPDSNTNSIIAFTSDREVLDVVQRVITTFDIPQKMVEIEQRIVTVSLQDLRSINFDYVLTNPLIEDIDLDPSNMDMSLGVAEGGLDEISTNPGLNFSASSFGQSRLDFMLSLLESTSSFQTLSAPKMLSISNPISPPFLFIGNQIPYAENVDFEDQGDDDPTNNRLTADFEVALAGVQLGFLPFILNDNHVYLEIQPQVTEAGERLPVQLTGEAPDDAAIPNIGPITFSQKFVNTSVRIKDGSTLVIGGLIEEKEQDDQNKTPFLSKIPFLGALFTDRSLEKTKISTIMFITVKIIEPDFD